LKLDYVWFFRQLGVDMEERSVKARRSASFWGIQIPGWLLLVYLVFAQGISALDYDIGVAMGTQEPVERITEVGAAFWYGFALGDVLTYIPILLAGLIGHIRGTRWGSYLMAAALGITVYWPVVCLCSLVAARGASGWDIASETDYWTVLPAITVWGVCGLISLVRNHDNVPAP